MRNILLTLICLTLIAASIPVVDDYEVGKKAPQHIGIDKNLAIYHLEFQMRAATLGIKFTRRVSIGFSKIKMKKKGKHVVGLCTYGDFFREIDIDAKYWKSASDVTKKTLMFHELGHCLCYRDHDWGKGTEYPDVSSVWGSLVQATKRMPFYKTQPGFFKDNCPMSTMYPQVLSDGCAEKHQEHYQKEIFERCRPY